MTVVNPTAAPGSSTELSPARTGRMTRLSNPPRSKMKAAATTATTNSSSSSSQSASASSSSQSASPLPLPVPPSSSLSPSAAVTSSHPPPRSWMAAVAADTDELPPQPPSSPVTRPPQPPSSSSPQPPTSQTSTLQSKSSPRRRNKNNNNNSHNAHNDRISSSPAAPAAAAAAPSSQQPSPPTSPPTSPPPLPPTSSSSSALQSPNSSTSTKTRIKISSNSSQNASSTNNKNNVSKNKNKNNINNNRTSSFRTHVTTMTIITTIWNWCMFVVEICCFCIDNLLNEWGVYNFLLNETEKTKKKNKKKDNFENDHYDDDYSGDNDDDINIGKASTNHRRRTASTYREQQQQQPNDDDKEKEIRKHPKSQRLDVLTKQVQYSKMMTMTMMNENDDYRNGVTASTIISNIPVNDDDSTMTIDMWEVRQLALSPGGLLNDTYRQALWPYLVGLVGQHQHHHQQQRLHHRSSNDDTTANTIISKLTTTTTTKSPTKNTANNKHRGDQHVLPVLTEEEEEEGITTISSNGSSSSNNNKETSTTRLIDNILEMPSDENTGGGSGGSQEAPYGEQQIQRHIDGCIDLIRRDAGRSVVFRYTVVVEEEEELQQHDVLVDGGGDGVSVSRTITSTLSAAPSYATQRLARVLEHVIRDGKRRHQLYQQQQQDRRSRSTVVGDSNIEDDGPIHYYQGLHDIAGVILHTVDYDVGLARQIVGQVCRSHLRDATRENFSNVTWLLQTFVPPLIQTIDSQVYTILIEYAQIDLATVCLPWTITWFTHDLHDPDTASRLVDIFLSSHPMLPLYLSVALITHPAFQDEIYSADYNDPAAVFMILKRMPLALREIGHDHTLTSKNDDNDTYHRTHHHHSTVSLQHVLEDALAIMSRYPPRSLLNLLDPNIHPRQELNVAVSKIAAFRTSSLGVVGCSNATIDRQQEPTIQSLLNVFDDGRSNRFVHAKLASGVPIWMNQVQNAPILHQQPSNWGSAQGQRILATTRSDSKQSTKKKKKKSKLQKLIKTLVGGKGK